MGEHTDCKFSTKLSMIRYELHEVLDVLGPHARVRVPKPDVQFHEERGIPMYAKNQVIVPYAYANDLLPTLESEKSIQQSRVLTTYAQCTGLALPRPPNKFSQSPLEETREESFRHFQVAKLAGLVLRRYRNRGATARYERTRPDRLENNPNYWFWAEWPMAWAGFMACLLHPVHAQYAEWLAEHCRADAQNTRRQALSRRELVGAAAQEYAAQYFQRARSLEVRLCSFLDALDAVRPWPIHQKAPSPIEELTPHFERPGGYDCHHA